MTARITWFLRDGREIVIRSDAEQTVRVHAMATELAQLVSPPGADPTREAVVIYYLDGPVEKTRIEPEPAVA